MPITADWGYPIAIILAAIIGAAGAWVGISIGQRARRLRRQDTVNRRNIRLINYAATLRDHLEDGGLPVPKWPDDLYDTEEGSHS